MNRSSSSEQRSDETPHERMLRLVATIIRDIGFPTVVSLILLYAILKTVPDGFDELRASVESGFRAVSAQQEQILLLLQR